MDIETEIKIAEIFLECGLIGNTEGKIKWIKLFTNKLKISQIAKLNKLIPNATISHVNESLLSYFKIEWK